MEKKIWGEKRYYSLDYYLKQTFGEKIYKIALDGGMTCPNRDGTLGTRGCIFCSTGGSGDFAAPRCASVTQQINTAIEGIQKAKTTGNKFIAYFQSYTNTYAPVDYLRQLFTEAIHHPSIAALSIGTRPDCLPKDVLELLEQLNQIKPVWVELGLQTIHEKTAQFIRRGYPLSVFEKAVKDLKERKIIVIVHTILGLPFETREDILATIDYIGRKPVDGIKLQLLHVLKGTDLAEYMEEWNTLSIEGTSTKLPSMEEYTDLVISCLERLPQHIVVHRITGDGPKKLLLAPLWSGNKKASMNHINKELKTRDTWQGKCYNENK